jgi:archaellin
MKRIALPMVLGLTLLVGCQNTDRKEETKPSSEQKQQKSVTKTETNATFPYPNLLSENEQSYSLLVVGDNDNPIEKNKKIIGKVNDILTLPELNMAQTAYPELNIKTEPAYILFDHAGVIHQSKDLKELTTYLEQK